MTDELDLVRQVRPGAHGPTPELVARERNALMAIAQGQGQSGTPASLRRRRLWAVPVVALVVGATAAAGYVVLNREVDHIASFTCQAEGVTAVLPNFGTPPLDACARLWEEGVIVTGVTTAPPLVACITSLGSITVIERKGERACKDADMAPWEDEGDFEAVGTAVRTVLIRFHDRFQATGGFDGGGNGCAKETEWRTELGGELTQAGLSQWKIDSDQVEEGRHCYDVGGIDPRTRTILLIGNSSDYSISCDPRTGC